MATDNAPFDAYALDYDRALARGLAISGEDRDYFARGRVSWLAASLRELGERPRRVMDFGCGTGSASPYLREVLGGEVVSGVDISAASVDVARRTVGSERVRFWHFDEYEPDGKTDLVFCNGVFHHIPPHGRAAALDYIRRSLRSGGLFALWENNPWSPGTRYVMSRIPFDWDAVTLRPSETRRLVGEGGFAVLRTDFLFIFPRVFHWLRWIEPLVCRLPIGAQYQVLCRKR
jgi:SAM-dependent methyltransferase